jgi:hypothetical protein
MEHKIKVVVSGIFYPLTMMEYIIRGLKRIKGVEVFTVGAFTGDYIPWNFGMRLPQKYVRTPDVPLPPELIGKKVPYAMVAPHISFEPQLWLQVDAGFHFIDKPKATVTALVKTDPHALSPQYYDEATRYSDVVFNMQKYYIRPNEFYLPYAYDEKLFYPMPEVEKIYDACLIGLHYEHRNKLVERLRSRGLNVYYSIGEVYDEYRLRYNQSKVALNWSSEYDLNARTFEAMGMSLALLTNRIPDLANFFVEDEHYIGFNTIDEAEANILKLLTNDELRNTIGKNAERKVNAGHRWKFRAKQILETCKLL